MQQEGNTIFLFQAKQMRGDNEYVDEEMDDVSTSHNGREVDTNGLLENFMVINYFSETIKIYRFPESKRECVTFCC